MVAYTEVVTVSNPTSSIPQFFLLGSTHRHLIQFRSTLDGNHQCNQFFKNTDPFDRSLYEGTSYFPEASEYLQFLESLGVISEQVCGEISHWKSVAHLACSNRNTPPTVTMSKSSQTKVASRTRTARRLAWSILNVTMCLLWLLPIWSKAKGMHLHGLHFSSMPKKSEQLWRR